MTLHHAQATRHFPMSSEHVASDFMALASHMTACQRSRGHFFTLRSALEALHDVTTPRLVTTGAVLVVCSLALLGLGLLALA